MCAYIQEMLEGVTDRRGVVAHHRLAVAEYDETACHHAVRIGVKTSQTRSLMPNLITKWTQVRNGQGLV